MKKKLIWFSTVLFLASLGLMAYGLRPMCFMIADEALGHFAIPIEQRADRDIYLKVFQKRDDGHWYHCKTAMSQ